LVLIHCLFLFSFAGPMRNLNYAEASTTRQSEKVPLPREQQKCRLI
jgi:hypothetical protein